MEGLKLLNGVFTAAYETWGGIQNVVNREERLGLLTDEADVYDEWVLDCLETELSVRCICGMQAQVNRSVILKSVKSDVRIYVGSTCLENFPRVGTSVLNETLDGYSREDNFVIDDASDVTTEMSESEEEDEKAADNVPTTTKYNLRKRPLPISKKRRGNTSAHRLLFDSCADYFSRKNHTQIEQNVFVGFLQSLF